MYISELTSLGRNRNTTKQTNTLLNE